MNYKKPVNGPYAIKPGQLKRLVIVNSL